MSAAAGTGAIFVSERVDLRFPINFKGRQITAVTLRWPPLDQVRRVQALGASADQTLGFIALMTALPRAAVDLMDLEDIGCLKDAIAKFVGYQPKRVENNG